MGSGRGVKLRAYPPHLVPMLKNGWSHTFSLAYVFVECIGTPFTFNFQALIGVSLPRVKIPVVQPIVSGRGGGMIRHADESSLTFILTQVLLYSFVACLCCINIVIVICV